MIVPQVCQQVNLNLIKFSKADEWKLIKVYMHCDWSKLFAKYMLFDWFWVGFALQRERDCVPRVGSDSNLHL